MKEKKKNRGRMGSRNDFSSKKGLNIKKKENKKRKKQSFFFVREFYNSREFFLGGCCYKVRGLHWYLILCLLLW